MYEYELYQQYYHGFQGRQQTPLNPASPEFQPRGYHVCREPRPPVSQQWEFYDSGQEGSEGNYEPAAEKASSYPSDVAAQRSPTQEDAPDELEPTPYPSLRPEIRSVSLIHRSSSLNKAAEQLGFLSTNTTTATLVPKVKRLSLPSLPDLLIPDLNALDAYAGGKGHSRPFQGGNSGGECLGQESISEKRVVEMENGMHLSLVTYLQGDCPMKFGNLGRCTVELG
jgi:hypothetical protein